jgi:hypothetical protein
MNRKEKEELLLNSVLTGLEDAEKREELRRYYSLLSDTELDAKLRGVEWIPVQKTKAKVTYRDQLHRDKHLQKVMSQNRAKIETVPIPKVEWTAEVWTDIERATADLLQMKDVHEVTEICDNVLGIATSDPDRVCQFMRDKYKAINYKIVYGGIG